MESTTEMLFSKANINEESAEGSVNATPNEIDKAKDIPQVINKEKLNSEQKNDISKEGLASSESERKLIPFSTNDAKDVNYEKELDEFIFPIVNSQKVEESKNSEMDNISSLNKALQSSSIADFSSLNLKIPDTLRQKNKFSHSISLNQRFTSNYSQNYGLSNIQNIFPSPSLPLQNFFGFVLKNGNISNFVPITFSCSIDIPRNRKGLMYEHSRRW